MNAAALPEAPESDFDSVAAPKLEAHFDHSRGRFLVADARGIWTPRNETQMARLFEAAGYDPDLPVSNPGSVAHMLMKIQEVHGVDYAGPLAGYKRGLYEMLGSRVLVTTEPRLITPKPGSWDIFGKVLKNLFVENEAERRARIREYGGDSDAPCIDQRVYFHGWVHVGVKALFNNKRYPGQALILAGERDCGKSLLQSIITEIFGGRAGKPYQSLTDSTNFNGDLFGAEHLVIGDEASKIDMRSRKALAAKLKGVVAEPVQRMEAKHRDALTLTPFWRLSFSLNTEPECLLVLPPVDEDIADKMMLCWCYKRPMPWQFNGPEDREAFWAALVAELPAYLHWVLNEFEIPVALRSRRFGIHHHHHPKILSVIDALSTDARLLELIDREVFASSRTEWKGSAMDLEAVLKGPDSSVREIARDLFTGANSCGSYLAKLASKHPTRVQQKRTSNHRGWILFPPVSSNPAPAPAVAVEPEQEAWAEQTGRAPRPQASAGNDVE